MGQFLSQTLPSNDSASVPKSFEAADQKSFGNTLVDLVKQRAPILSGLAGDAGVSAFQNQSPPVAQVVAPDVGPATIPKSSGTLPALLKLFGL